jgi:hypothetical protein
MQDSLTDLQADKLQTAIKDLPSPAVYNKDIYSLELGRLQQLSGDYADSLKTYDLVIADVESQQYQAKIRVSAMLENTGAVLVNDNVLPYVLPGYEVILLYQYQAFNYLALGNLQNALVMLRKAQYAQQFMAEQHEEEIAKAQEAAQKQPVKVGQSTYPAEFNAMMAATSSVKSEFLNPLTDYFASLMYAATGDTNNAVVSLKKALAVAPDNPYLRTALLFALQNQNNTSQLAEYLRAFNMQSAPAVPNNAGTLAIIYEQGLVPAMQQVQVPIPVQGVVLAVSFPYYDSSTQLAASPLSIVSNGQPLGNTATLTNTGLLAEKALVGDYPLIALRAAIRLSLQVAGVIASNSNSQQSSGGSIAVMLYSLLTANADLRSWLTLPANEQIFQLNLASGTYQLGLSNGLTTQAISVNLQAGKICLIWVTQIGTKLQVNTFNL